ncbi:MAG TPA: hypothetical protein VND68_01960, partial [Chloroflexia bacterium]|nr:hypothetical protein [Chloroflexia bacterium]
METGLVLLAYALLTALFTWPLILHFTQTLPDGGDGWQEMWGLWWVKTALVDLHTNIYRTHLLYYPDGVSLYFHPLQPVTGLLSVPLQLAGLNLPTAYNLLVWLSFVAAGYGMYLLVRHLTVHRPAAFLAGVVFTFCPYHFAHMLGQLNLMSYQWMPFYLLALFKAWGDPAGATRQLHTVEQPQLSSRHQLIWASAAGLWFAINAYTDWLYAMLLGLCTAWFIAWQLFAKVRSRQGERRPERSGEVWWRLASGKLGVQGGVCLVLLAPTLTRMWQEMQSSSHMKAIAEEVRLFSADLTDVVVPNYFTLMWRGLLSPVLTEHYAERFPAERLVFVGYAVLILGIVAVLQALSSRPRNGGVLFWAWTALGAWVLSLGPVLHVWGNSTFWGIEVPLPYALLTSVPGFDVFRVPSRIMVLAMLALAVLVGYALAAHSRKHETLEPGAPQMRAKWGYWLACLALITVEFIPAPFPMMRQNYDLTFYQEVAREQGDFAILDLPMQPVPIYMAYQTIHRKPIVGGYVSRLPPPSVVAQMPV